jgi:hypothetical protein
LGPGLKIKLRYRAFLGPGLKIKLRYIPVPSSVLAFGFYGFFRVSSFFWSLLSLFSFSLYLSLLRFLSPLPVLFYIWGYNHLIRKLVGSLFLPLSFSLLVNYKSSVSPFTFLFFGPPPFSVLFYKWRGEYKWTNNFT